MQNPPQALGPDPPAAREGFGSCDHIANALLREAQPYFEMQATRSSTLLL